MTDQTPTPPPLDLAALTEIAKAVEPLEWTVAIGGVGTSVYSNWDNEHGDYAQRIADGLSSEEAEHIAAFDPPTALALIARITAAESSLARYIVERTRFGDAMAADAVAPVVDAIMRELTADADKRAREATARAEAAEAKVAAVREMVTELRDTTPQPGTTGYALHMINGARAAAADILRSLDGKP